jgi:hypothetical protein
LEAHRASCIPARTSHRSIGIHTVHSDERTIDHQLLNCGRHDELQSKQFG